MPIPAQYAANRLNRKIPRRRAPTEDMDACNAFSKEIVDSLDVQTPVERQFAQTVEDNQWRINRIRSIEDGMLGIGHFEAAGDFDCPSPEIHSLRQLKELQTEGRERGKTAMDDAIRLLKTQQMKGSLNDPASNGLVHVSAEIARRARHEDAL